MSYDDQERSFERQDMPEAMRVAYERFGHVRNSREKFQRAHLVAFPVPREVTKLQIEMPSPEVTEALTARYAPTAENDYQAERRKDARHIIENLPYQPVQIEDLGDAA